MVLGPPRAQKHIAFPFFKKQQKLMLFDMPQWAFGSKLKSISFCVFFEAGD